PSEPGWTTLHHTRVQTYFEALRAGRFPVERGFRYGPRELRLNVLFQMLHSTRVDLEEYRRLFRLDLLAEHLEIWAALERRGWAEVDQQQIRLVGDGVFHTPLIQTLVARDDARAEA
ncbi:MAG: hypothetical protein KDD47_10465, partial [Acidobacteria bacterium]|nr:hypothetical protein [Acidobacteriota bacterium]